MKLQHDKFEMIITGNNQKLIENVNYWNVITENSYSVLI